MKAMERSQDVPGGVLFRVPFVKGMPRPRVTRNGAYTPAEAVECKVAVREAFRRAFPGPYPMVPAPAPVSVSVRTMRRLPDSRPRRVDYEPDVYRPDADNVAKLVLDALNGLAYGDDSQVTVLHVHKFDRVRGKAEYTEVEVAGMGVFL